VKRTLPATALKLTQSFFPGLLASKKWRKTSTKGGVPKMVTQYREGRHEGPAVGMQLGGGHVDLRQQHPLEAGKGEMQLDPFKDSLIEEEEGHSFIGLVIGAHWFALAQGRTET